MVRITPSTIDTLSFILKYFFIGVLLSSLLLCVVAWVYRWIGKVMIKYFCQFDNRIFRKYISSPQDVECLLPPVEGDALACCNPQTKQSSYKEFMIRENDSSDSDVDKKPSLVFEVGEVMIERYEVKEYLDEGTFGQVVSAYDHIERCLVAIKIVKNSTKHLDTALEEIIVLRAIHQADPDGNHSIVQFKNYFLWKSHMCMVFELLSYTLLDLLRQTGYCGIPLVLTRCLGLQLCVAIDFLSSPLVGVIHCDIKPENVLIADLSNFTIKLIDFGCAHHVYDKKFFYVQTRFYRSPEILLGIPYDFAIDIWSIGCLLVEMYVGTTLFRGDNEFDQMNKIIEVLGMPPQHLLDQGVKTSNYFEKTASGSYIMKKETKKKYQPPGTRRLEDILDVNIGNPLCRPITDLGHSTKDCTNFKNLILKMLEYDPKDRITACDALNHDFFKYSHHKDSTNQSLTSTCDIRYQNSLTKHDSTLKNNIKYREYIHRYFNSDPFYCVSYCPKICISLMKVKYLDEANFEENLSLPNSCESLFPSSSLFKRDRRAGLFKIKDQLHAICSRDQHRAKHVPKLSSLTLKSLKQNLSKIASTLNFYKTEGKKKEIVRHRYRESGALQLKGVNQMPGPSRIKTTEWREASDSETEELLSNLWD